MTHTLVASKECPSLEGQGLETTVHVNVLYSKGPNNEIQNNKQLLSLPVQ